MQRCEGTSKLFHSIVVVGLSVASTACGGTGRIAGEPDAPSGGSGPDSASPDSALADGYEGGMSLEGPDTGQSSDASGARDAAGDADGAACVTQQYCCANATPVAQPCGTPCGYLVPGPGWPCYV